MFTPSVRGICPYEGLYVPYTSVFINKINKMQCQALCCVKNIIWNIRYIYALIVPLFFHDV